MRHQAIYETHPNVVRIDDSFGAFDKDDNLVVLNESRSMHRYCNLRETSSTRGTGVQLIQKIG